jgi:hypothetical protein
MHGSRFDTTIKSMTLMLGSRRGLLRSLAGSALGAALAGPCRSASAAKCRKNGLDCRGSNQCCSGRCAGGKCRPAPGQDVCTIEKLTCDLGKEAARCGVGNLDCACYRRINGAAYCANVDSVTCAPCANDQDCIDFLGPGRVCLRAAGALCCAGEGESTACARPCPTAG